MNSSNSLRDCAGRVGDAHLADCQSRLPGLAIRFLSAADLVFAIVLLMSLFAGTTGFFNDPGTGWHVRLGREMLQTGALPRCDTFTWSRSGTPWVDQSWVIDIILAWLVDHFGWPGAVAMTALTVSWAYAFLTAGLRKDGASPLVAVVVGAFSAGIGAIHFLARPLLATFIGVLITQRLCRAYHFRGSRAIWIMPIVVAIWANLHGGFLAGPLIVGTTAAVQWVIGSRDGEGRRRTLVLVVVFVLCLAAPLVNPYGLGLYRHVFHLLSESHVTDLISEYQPAPFGKGETGALEITLLGLIGLLAVSTQRPTVFDLTQTIVWLHFALVSFRHAPLFALAAAPMLAMLLDGVLSKEHVLPSRCPRFLGSIVVSILLIGITLAGLLPGGLSPKRWPLTAILTVNEQPTELRMFHEQDWGGLIEMSCEPKRLAALDDRFELWGRQPILEYLDVLTGGPAWDEIRDRDGIDLVWLRPKRGLVRRLRNAPEWAVLFEDEVSVLLRREGSPAAP